MNDFFLSILVEHPSSSWEQEEGSVTFWICIIAVPLGPATVGRIVHLWTYWNKPNHYYFLNFGTIFVIEWILFVHCIYLLYLMSMFLIILLIILLAIIIISCEVEEEGIRWCHITLWLCCFVRTYSKFKVLCDNFRTVFSLITKSQIHQHSTPP